MEEERTSWRPRWWIAYTAIVLFHVGLVIAMYEVLSGENNPAALSLAGALLIGSPAAVALDKIASR